MKSVFDKEHYEKFLARIEKLTPETQPKWGKMNAAQMLAHCSEIQEVMNGKALKGTPLLVKFLARLFRQQFKKILVNEKPYKKNVATHPQYRMAGSQREFETEKKRLLQAFDRFVHEDPQVSDKIEHPLFGKMTRDEKGWAIYKHLDHHLGQFGV